MPNVATSAQANMESPVIHFFQANLRANTCQMILLCKVEEKNTQCAPKCYNSDFYCAAKRAFVEIKPSLPQEAQKNECTITFFFLYKFTVPDREEKNL